MTATVARPGAMYATPPATPVTIRHGHYTIQVCRGERVVASAVRTGWDTWHIPVVPRRPHRDPCAFCGEFHRLPLEPNWLAADTRDGAELALLRLATYGSTT